MLKNVKKFKEKQIFLEIKKAYLSPIPVCNIALKHIISKLTNNFKVLVKAKTISFLF